MADFILKGHICHSLDRNQIAVYENHYLICADDHCVGVFSEVPATYQNIPVTDYGDRIIIPGMSDLHIHAPQFAFRGLGMDMELLDWLNVHAFPEESKYADLAYADVAYEQFVTCLRRSETTRLSVFATLHREATELLMEKLEKSGLVSCVGKLNMDRNSPDYYREPSAEYSLAETRKWLEETVGKYKHTTPIITPRFIPSCSDDVMYGIGKLCREFGVPSQSHISENLGEIAWVKELVPAARNYGDAYQRFGVFGGDHRCIMAHCVYSDELEMQMMKENGVFIAHSPESNMNVASGVAPINKYLDYGLRVGLATDVAGGSHASMFKAMTHAIQSSKIRWRLLDQSVPFLTFDTAFFIATRGGGEFFGKVGAFEPGYELDAVVLDDSDLLHPQPLTVKDRLERIAYLGDEHNIVGKYVAGQKLF